MRKLTTALVAASTAIALASTAAIAQVARQSSTGTTPTFVTSGSPSTTDATPNGANTTVMPPTVGSTVPSAQAPAAAPSGTATTTATATNLGADPVNIPNAARTSSALGRSPGQTSAGTAAGNSSAGIGVGSETLGVSGTATATNANNGTFVGGTVAGLPVTGAIVGGVGMGTETGVNANGERTAGTSGSTVIAASSTLTPTPIFDMTARQGLAKQQQRRAQGREPTIIGLAPRTNVDRTWQMPDDPIIRY